MLIQRHAAQAYVRRSFRLLIFIQGHAIQAHVRLDCYINIFQDPYSSATKTRRFQATANSLNPLLDHKSTDCGNACPAHWSLEILIDGRTIFVIARHVACFHHELIRFWSPCSAALGCALAVFCLGIRPGSYGFWKIS